MVKLGREAELWASVSPEKMSDEEKEGEGYVRHPQHTNLSLKILLEDWTVG